MLKPLRNADERPASRPKGLTLVTNSHFSCESKEGSDNYEHYLVPTFEPRIHAMRTNHEPTSKPSCSCSWVHRSGCSCWRCSGQSRRSSGSSPWYQHCTHTRRRYSRPAPSGSATSIWDGRFGPWWCHWLKSSFQPLAIHCPRGVKEPLRQTPTGRAA